MTDAIEKALRILGLGPEATSEEIQQAYRDLAMVWHPDRFPDDSRVRGKAEEKFKNINEAYRILRDYDGDSRAHAGSDDAHSTGSQQGHKHSRAQEKHDEASPTKEHSGLKPPISQRQLIGIRASDWAYVFVGLAMFAIVAFVAYKSTTAPQSHPASAANTPSSRGLRHPSSLPAANAQNASREQWEGVTWETPPVDGTEKNESTPKATMPWDNDLAEQVGDTNRIESTSREMYPWAGFAKFDDSQASGEKSNTIEATVNSSARLYSGVDAHDLPPDPYAVTPAPTSASPNQVAGVASDKWWEQYPLAESISAGQTNNTSPVSFTIGSHKDEVLRLQGTPTAINTYPAIAQEVWSYGNSTVKISTETGLVTEWRNDGNLKVSLKPGNNVSKAEYFTLDSHKDDVLRLQGTPTMIHRYPSSGYEVWSYGLSTVEISTKTDRVTECHNSGNLKVSLKPGGNVTKADINTGQN